MVKIGRRRAVSSLAVVLAALGGAPLAAGTMSGTMTVTATVEESCHLEARPMIFGTVRGADTQFDARSSLTVACTPDAAYVVTMDEGQQAANGKRRMAAFQGGGFLEYDIFLDPARTQRWAASPANSLSGIAPAGGTAFHAIYGRTTASGGVLLTAYGRANGNHSVASPYEDIVTVAIAF